MGEDFWGAKKYTSVFVPPPRPAFYNYVVRGGGWSTFDHINLHPLSQLNVMPAVHSLWVHLGKVSGESCQRQDWTSVTLYTLAKNSQFWCATRGDSQARHETLWPVHHGPLKKRYLNEAKQECRGYTRGSKARRVFPSTFSLSLCLGFPRRECTAGINVTSFTNMNSGCDQGW